ncbi:MAG: hypothetical protein GC181_13920 [Bacteroidetes bacterium]|nr:hypothetical protein [Bacteroidota bacterium]
MTIRFAGMIHQNHSSTELLKSYIKIEAGSFFVESFPACCWLGGRDCFLIRHSYSEGGSCASF